MNKILKILIAITLVLAIVKFGISSDTRKFYGPSYNCKDYPTEYTIYGKKFTLNNTTCDNDNHEVYSIYIADVRVWKWETITKQK